MTLVTVSWEWKKNHFSTLITYVKTKICFKIEFFSIAFAIFFSMVYM